jgi:uncharacterized protein
MMLTSDHPHAELLARIYGTVGAGGGPQILEAAISEPFVAHTAGHGPIGGDHVGAAGFTGHIALLRALSGGTLRRASIEFWADDRWAVVPQTLTATRHGRTLEMEVAGFWRFGGPQELVEHWEAVADPAAWDAFWNAPAPSTPAP